MIFMTFLPEKVYQMMKTCQGFVFIFGALICLLVEITKKRPGFVALIILTYSEYWLDYFNKDWVKKSVTSCSYSAGSIM